MDVSSVNSSVTPPPAPKPQQTEQTQAPRRTESSETGESQQPQQSSEPKPVVNVQGQTTGRIVNTSA